MQLWLTKHELQLAGMKVSNDGLLIEVEKGYRRDVLKLLRKIIRVLVTPDQWEKEGT
jgi:hypothetical protein